MKICRYRLAGQATSDRAERIGVLLEDSLRDVSAVLEELPAARWPFPMGDLLIANLERLRPRIMKLAREAAPIPLGQVHFHAPVANPGKIICGVGNWPHWKAASGKTPEELGLFFKATSALVGPSDGVALRRPELPTLHEIELAIIIGKGGTMISADRAPEHVAGYAIGLDMTLKSSQNPSYRKCADSYAVVGPWMTTADEIPDPAAISYRFYVNDELDQEYSYDQLLLSVPRLIEFASGVMTLHPGDIILSGTPKFDPVKPGDVLRADFALLGSMRTTIRAYAHVA